MIYNQQHIAVLSKRRDAFPNLGHIVGQLLVEEHFAVSPERDGVMECPAHVYAEVDIRFGG